MENNQLRIIISGGGTGGHIFPAISIANAIREIRPDADILFAGAEGRMEMEKVPQAGYKIVGLPVAGFSRSLTPKNLIVVLKLMKSLIKAYRIVRNFKPHVVVGVGGYASGPIVKAAQRLNIPTLLQEQNSYAGVTNKLLAKKAKKICVAYEGMERYFPAEKIMLTGNPVRQDIENLTVTRTEGLAHFGIDPSKKVLLVLGGSLGARTLNQSLLGKLDVVKSNPDIVVIWQTGKLYYQTVKEELEKNPVENIRLFDFIRRMDLAYVAADAIISRAGAGTISELCLVAKPCILVPSPNVAEDHQTRNALALTNKNAAIMVPDSKALEQLVNEAFALLNDESLQKKLSENIAKLALRDSAKVIANEVLKLVNKNSK
ncbi:MAG: UDP-N-acetylglucosamine--N-acetylmuramyl-(pentapeptide) pyrophosphoryl-undecaprenol [Tenuifilum sp.]|jgi:UDP-N-acetylglucosamine--N-acetylmuramyl-(pentapeptide) pyrophosphoryl-undecaprenol N-acetylglucosamine transferase|uniref:undecaprenyldiphospho-muramoylpentapeptide beta-N-acetylglucosaminyltransferase n=1 Tax=Tenuifilum sp. TaxID=2760880 RepID=UPI0024AB2369|nr:undecaprenyldiphospho-muramoylpentapeptide beta-N-acetylglucosaminyltransferase [Tenuifilum sp.]MDI3526185.1 UDP-N-acetylglucosamine--N-acetylmuramyl-(pentapeptide) pyrophosphoryl-undecaprenol [Tenuifilum sp.]